MKTFGCCHLLLSLLNPVSVTSSYITSISSVRALVTKHAFASYFMNEIVNDIVDKPVILHNIMDLTNPKVNFGFELTTVSIISYLVYKYYYDSIYSFYNKFNKLPEFKKYYRKFKFCIFVLTIVLTKEIGNAI
jgi:hypothetical protein